MQAGLPAGQIIGHRGLVVTAALADEQGLADYLRELAAISQPRLANAPGRGRRRRMLYTVLLPAT